MEKVDVELFIHLVRIKEYLYNKGHKSYKDILRKQNAWNEIAETIASTSEICEKLWKTLKERYTRERKRISKPTSSSAARDKSWVWFDDMKFLDDFIQQRRRYIRKPGTIQADNLSENNSQMSYNSYNSDSQMTEVNVEEPLAVCETQMPSVSFPSTSNLEDANPEYENFVFPCTSSLGDTIDEPAVLELGTPPSKRLKTMPLKKRNVNQIDSEILKTLDTINLNMTEKAEEKEFGNLVAYELQQIADKGKRREIKQKIMNLIYTA